MRQHPPPVVNVNKKPDKPEKLTVSIFDYQTLKV